MDRRAVRLPPPTVSFREPRSSRAEIARPELGKSRRADRAGGKLEASVWAHARAFDRKAMSAGGFSSGNLLDGSMGYRRHHHPLRQPLHVLAATESERKTSPMSGLCTQGPDQSWRRTCAPVLPRIPVEHKPFCVLLPGINPALAGRSVARARPGRHPSPGRPGRPVSVCSGCRGRGYRRSVPPA